MFIMFIMFTETLQSPFGLVHEALEGPSVFRVERNVNTLSCALQAKPCTWRFMHKQNQGAENIFGSEAE